MAGDAGIDDLTEDERRALRGSKFAPLPVPPPPSLSHPRLAHPGGPLKTNKAAALAKFMERKLQDPEGLKSINPDLLEAAVENAKKTVFISSVPGASTSGRKVLHVDSFGDSIEDSSQDEKKEAVESKKKKRKRKKKKVSRDNLEEGVETEKKKKKKKKKKEKEKKMKSEQKGAKKKKSKL